MQGYGKQCAGRKDKSKFKKSKRKWKKSFELFEGQQKTFADECNCRKGEMLTGLRRFYKGKKEFIQLQCEDISEIAEMSEEMGCTLSLMNPAARPVGREKPMLRNPAKDKSGCPKSVMKGLQMSKQGLMAKYCFMKMKGKKYDEKKCKEEMIEKEEITTVEETTGVEHILTVKTDKKMRVKKVTNRKKLKKKSYYKIIPNKKKLNEK